MKTSDLLQYSSEYERMRNNFDGICSKDAANHHPILKKYNLDDFYFQKLISPNDIDDYDFFSLSRELGVCNVPKRKIVGTTHSIYQGKTWLMMLTEHPRVICKTEAEITDLIPFEKQEQKIHLLKYRDQYFIANGNNRICQAQFVDAIDKIPCLVTEFIFDQDGFDRYTLLSCVGAEFVYHSCYKEGDIVTAGYKGIIFHFPYTEEGVDQCFSVILMADSLYKDPFRRFIFKLIHRKTNQKWFNLDQPGEWNKAVRAALDRMLSVSDCKSARAFDSTE